MIDLQYFIEKDIKITFKEIQNSYVFVDPGLCLTDDPIYNKYINKFNKGITNLEYIFMNILEIIRAEHEKNNIDKTTTLEWLNRFASIKNDILEYFNLEITNMVVFYTTKIIGEFQFNIIALNFHQIIEQYKNYCLKYIIYDLFKDTNYEIFSNYYIIDNILSFI